ncbi:enoyl-CoA hydratase/isomerase family protein [Cupriavidus lacunae]|uniref:Enoyl-CoA hydratase/isomerase family protein n=1 Tax=Cupriavidus lacunae TaxID=2666307 RepID=A0A370NX32_9BURK|nr:enoyl-CoA hydratase-related protein [Cupriavidus lacunae]RDK10088.1 enoyl-CoA hydratase/isomerase family protein [Cupriavidus lacunae]
MLIEELDSPALKVELADGVATLTMHVPSKRNALTPELYEGLARALAALQDNDACRAVLLTGGAHFCSGGDVGGLDVSGLVMRRNMQIGQQVVRTMIGGRLPVVAAVQGAAFGAGFSLAMASDFVFADANATFCAAFGRLGLTPDYGLLWSLPQRVSMGAAREILMLCDPIPATQARALGLVDVLTEAGQVLEQARERALRLAKAPPATIATTKAVLSRVPMSLDTMLAWEADTQSLLAASADFREGCAAFAERRPAVFLGR